MVLLQQVDGKFISDYEVAPQRPLVRALAEARPPALHQPRRDALRRMALVEFGEEL